MSQRLHSGSGKSAVVVVGARQVLGHARRAGAGRAATAHTSTLTLIQTLWLCVWPGKCLGTRDGLVLDAPPLRMHYPKLILAALFQIPYVVLMVALGLPISALAPCDPIP